MYNKQAGNVLFLVLIAVLLFGGLTYSVTQSARSAPGTIEGEEEKLDQAVLNNCEVSVNLALMKLRNLGNCDDDEINYEMPDGSNANPNAPVDGHCNIFHPAYGGATPCGIDTDPSCDLTTLSIGSSCGGIVYAGESGGNRIYTTRADHSTGVAWNNGTANYTVTTATDNNDGAANTDTLVALSDAGAPYEAAQLCRTQGANWYLPSRNEMGLLYTNRAAIGNFDETSWYWTSTENSSTQACRRLFSNGATCCTTAKSIIRHIRCVKKD